MVHRVFFGARLRVAGAMAVACGLASAADAQFAEPDAVALQTFTGAPGESYGWAVADLTDIDGDGVKEVISGAPFNGALGIRTGRLEVRSGATGALLHEFNGLASEDFLGYAIADAGDVDGDGVADIVAGGPRTAGVTGKAVVWSGATGAVLHTLVGPADTTFLGGAVSGAGDINGDGHDDLLVGAPLSPAGVNDGVAYVFSGADGSVLRTYPGDTASRFGFGAALAGDIDGDGVGEHIVGAPWGGYAEVYSGATGAVLHRFNAEPTGGAFGQFFVSGAGDVDADGTPDFYVGDYGDDATPADAVAARGAAYVFSGADGSRIRLYHGAEGDGMGPGRSAGDVNGDGADDLIIGLYTNSDAVSQGGRIDVVSGADGAILRTFTGTQFSAQLGFDCVGMGDADGDGEIDFILSAANGSRVYIASGAAAVCVGDLTGDGLVDGADLGQLLGAWGTDAAGADLSDDGVVDGADLGLLLGAWGACA
jgi:hypothetical protein